MEMKQILVFVGRDPEKLRTLINVLESNQINVNAIVEGQEAFWGFVHIVLPEPEQAIEALIKAGFAIFTPGRHESPVFKYNAAESVPVCA